MAHPPLTKRRIPMTIRAWRAEVIGIRNFLKRLDRLEKDNGTKYVQNMRAYNVQRLDDLLDNAPPVLVERGEARQARDGDWT